MEHLSMDKSILMTEVRTKDPSREERRLAMASDDLFLETSTKDTSKTITWRGKAGWILKVVQSILALSGQESNTVEGLLNKLQTEKSS